VEDARGARHICFQKWGKGVVGAWAVDLDDRLRAAGRRGQDEEEGRMSKMKHISCEEDGGGCLNCGS